ncbi:MAG: O-antigen ligase family protein [Dechloromonas sp.]|uniref:O-antigen ligase family protein n=1 Tax=Dechloromonas sp. TaxID=1917218 RepID=UPI0027F45FA0|nr:O-antigen ligase family protein [Dechloromonas sp.]MBT9520599.1 O-antigen ligase family protein [Dechloromonas sp.]
MKFFGKSCDSHAVACVLMCIVGISVLFSPPVMNLAALLLLAVILSSAELRQSLWATWRLPMVKFVLLFYAVMIVGTTYSIAPKDIAVRMAIGWSKLLLLPIALSLFADPRWKSRFLKAFVGVLTVCAVVSFGLWFLEIDLPVASRERGVFLRNHATQGMAFAVGALSAFILAVESGAGRLRRLYVSSALLMLANIALVTTGRSGYLVAMVCAVGAVSGYVFFGQRRLGIRGIVGAVLLVIGVAGILLLAPASRGRMMQGVQEIQQYEQAKEETSMGIRMVFWKNTIEMIREQPLLGYGTGAFGTAYDHKVAGRTGVAATPAGDPHNQYMKITAENGIFALLVFFGFLLAAARQRCVAPWRLLGLCVLASWCATSFFNSHFSTFNEGNFIYAWLGIMLAPPVAGTESV